MVGTTLLDRYRLDEVVGRGGMGVVYRGHDVTLDRTVAIKVLASARPDREALTRLRNEAQVAARLQHPHIVSVFDAGEADGVAYIVMEYVDGRPLSHSTPVALADAAAIGQQLCDALAHAHAHQVVHRDIKPANVLVRGEAGRYDVKLADLGIARIHEATRITSEGALVGTASYLAPEQALGGTIDGRTDLYALGVVLYELTTGRLPFTGDDPLSVISQHLHAPIVPPRTYCEDIPPAFEALILRCMAKDPAGRYATAEEVGAALGAVTFDGPQAPANEAAETDPVALLDQLSRGHMSGRGEQLQQLRELWQRAMKGQPHLALVSGEPGVGKSRLARELVVLGRLQGAALLQGGCYEFEATTPYLPWVEGLRQWVNDMPAQTLREVLGDTAPELARLAPEIETKLGSQASAPALGPQQERLRLFDAIARFLQRLAARQGLLVFLDDLHWADHGTLQLLHYVMRNLRDDQLLVLGCYREVELDRQHPLSAALIEWNRERFATRIPIGRLALEDTERMLAAMFGQQSVSPDFATAIHRETEGNPFFVEEVIKSLIEHGQIYRAAGAWQRKDVAELTIPQSIKAAVGRRLSRLTPDTMTVLHTAAALGKVFEFNTLVAVSEAGEDALLDALDEASTAQLVRPEAREQFAFTHDKIREVLHDELNPIRQRRLHQRIGESLEKLYAADIDHHAEDLAYHFAQGSDVEKGLRYSLSAAEQAEKVYALEEAIHHYDRARDCAEGLEQVDQLAAIERRMAMVYEMRGDQPRATEHGERALALFRERKDKAEMRAVLGNIYVTVGDPRGREHLAQALDELDEATQPVALGRATMALGRYEHLRGRHGAALEHLQRAVGIFEKGDEADIDSTVFSYLAGAYQHLARWDESLSWAQRSIEWGTAHDYPLAVALGHEFIAEDSFWLGRLDEGLRAAGSNIEIGRRIGALDRVGWAEFIRSHHLRELGRIEESAAAGRASAAISTRLGETRLLALALDATAMALAHAGVLDEADALLDQSFAIAEANQHMYLSFDTLATRGFVQHMRGAHAEALRLFEAAAAVLRESDNRLLIMQVGPWHAETLVAAGRVDEAGTLVEHTRAVARTTGSRLIEGSIARVEGQRLIVTSQPERAIEHLDEAMRLAEALGARLEYGRSLLHRSRALERIEAGRGAGDQARAEDMLRAAGATAWLHAPERDGH